MSEACRGYSKVGKADLSSDLPYTYRCYGIIFLQSWVATNPQNFHSWLMFTQSSSAQGSRLNVSIAACQLDGTSKSAHAMYGSSP